MYIDKKLLKKQIRKGKERAKIAYKILNSIDKNAIVCDCCRNHERYEVDEDNEFYSKGQIINYCKLEEGSGVSSCIFRYQKDGFMFEPLDGIK